MSIQRNKGPTVHDRVSQAYHDFGRVCSAHPVACMSLSIATMLVLSYPAITRFRLPVTSPIDVHWSEHPVVAAGESAPEWLSSSPAVFLQQIIVRGVVEPWNSLNLTSEQAVRGPLSRAFTIRDTIIGDEGVDTSCLHISNAPPSQFLPIRGCMLLSPSLLWKSPDHFRRDPDILASIFASECTPALCIRDIVLGLPTGVTGIKRNFQTNRKRSIDFSLTLFFAQYDSTVRSNLKQKFAESGEFILQHSKEADEDTFVHVFYRPRKYFRDYFPLVTSYFVLMLYLYYSARKFEMVASRWGLAFAAAFSVASTLLMTTGICAHLDLLVSLWSAEIFPYLALIMSMENTLCITRSVVNTPPSLDVSSRIAHGLSQEGYTLCKYFVLELIFLAAGYSTRVPEIQEWCFVAAIGLVVDFYMQLFFYAPCLTFDLQRLNKDDKLRFGRMMLSTDIPLLKTFPLVSCPMRKVWPRLFEMKRRKKRTFSDSQLDERDVPQAMKAHRRSISVSKSDHASEAEGRSLLTDGSTSARLRLLYFVTRTRIMQRSIMVLFAIWTLWLAFIVHSNRTIDGGTGFGISHRLLETAPQQWGDWQRRTFKWWPVLFGQYNISLSGQYITFLPPIVLASKISPLDPMLFRLPTINDKVDTTNVDHSTTALPDDLQSRIYWLETQLKVYLATFWLLLLSSVVLFVLYACFWGRWRNGWTRAEDLTPQGKSSSLDTTSSVIESVPTAFAAAGHRFPIESISSCDTSRLVSVCHEGKVILWNAETGERILKLQRLRMPQCASDPPPPIPPQVWSVSASEELVVLGCADGSVEVACLERNKLIGLYHQSNIGAAHLQLVGNNVVVGRLDGSLDFIELVLTTDAPLRISSIRLVQTARAHLKPISQMLSTATAVITASHDHTVKMWDICSGSLLHIFLAHNSPVMSVCLSESADMLLSSCDDGVVCWWKLSSGQLIRSVDVPTNSGTVLLGCAKDIAVGYSGDCELRIWEEKNGQMNTVVRRRNATSADSMSVVCLSRDLAVTSEGITVVFWNLRTKDLLGTVDLGSFVDRIYRLNDLAIICQCSSTLYRVNVPVLRKK